MKTINSDGSMSFPYKDGTIRIQSNRYGKQEWSYRGEILFKLGNGSYCCVCGFVTLNDYPVIIFDRSSVRGGFPVACSYKATDGISRVLEHIGLKAIDMWVYDKDNLIEDWDNNWLKKNNYF